MLLCALLGACTKVGPASGVAGGNGEHTWTHPGELRVAIQADPVTLNPLLAANTTEGFLNRLSFDTLVSISPDGKALVPRLAVRVPTVANGDISADGLTIKYALRRGVVWQDGAPFSSKDVKFSWQAMMNDANNVNSRIGYDDVSRVDVPDPLTVVFHLKAKFAPFVSTIFAESDNPVCVVPQHILGAFKDLNRVAFNQLPIGTGPFRVVRWNRGDRVELVANPHYYLGVPKLKSIVVKTIPDENTGINALRTHDVDWMFEPSPNLFNVLKTLPDTVIHFVDGPQTLRMFINNKRPLLQDIRIRRAIAYATDKAALVQRLTGGSARAAGADQPPYSWAYRQDVATYGPDPLRAKALLRQAGFTFGSDGLARKGGQPLSFDLSTNSSNATRRLVETQLQSMLRAAGIDVVIKNYPGSTFFATYGQGGVMATGHYDLAISGWIAGSDPDDHSLYLCNAVPPNGTNYDRYCSPEMDTAQRAALASYVEPQRRLAYRTIQALIARDVPEIVIWYARFPQATNPDFRGFAPNPVNEAWNAYQWEI